MAPAIHDFQYRETVQTTLRALQWLQEHWNELAGPTQADIAAAARLFLAYLQDSNRDFKQETAAAEFLHAVEDALPASPLVQDLLLPAHVAVRRGISFLWEEDIQQLPAAIQALPPASGPAVAAETARPKTPTSVFAAAADSRPSRQDSQFKDLAATAARVIKALRDRWDELPADDRDRSRDLEQALAEELREAEIDLARAGAVNRYLNAIAGLAGAQPIVAAILNEQRRPVYRDAGPLSAEDAASLVEFIYGPPHQAAVGPDPFEDSYAKPGDAVPRNGNSDGLTPETTIEAAETTVELHTKVEFPGEVSIFDQAVPLIVRLTPQEAVVTVAKGVVRVAFRDVAQPEQVDVMVNAEGFDEVTEDLSRTILVYAGRASQPAVFLLTPRETGRKRIVIDFRHKGRPVGTVSFQTEVKDRPPLRRDANAVMEPLFAAADETPSLGAGEAPSLMSARMDPAGSPAPVYAAIELPKNPPEPVDLELRVTLSSDRQTLRFMLHSPKGAVGYHWTTAGEMTLDAEPRFFLEQTFKRLSKMARSSTERRSEEEDQQYRTDLDDIGRYLYEKLFSPDLKAEYRKIREKQQQGLVQNLLITSDEPWIPWELVKPYEADPETGETILDDDFLCGQFRLSRWLAGRGIPDSVQLSNVLLVIPDSNLDYVKAEKAYFEGLAASLPNIGVTGLLQSSAEVRQALQGAAAELYHFACHGNFTYDDPDESSLVLGGQLFAPSQVVGPVQAGVTRSKPLVFLNACHSGQVGFALTGLGGWAERFVKGGASAFIGTLWEVNDKLAAEFAIHFYDRLWQGASLGVAFHSAREQIRKLDDANPTWLAYTLYADPNGRAQVGKAA